MAKTNLSDFFQYSDANTETYTYNGRKYDKTYGVFESADGKQAFISPMNATLSRMLKLGEYIKSPQFSYKLNRGKSKSTGRQYNIQSLELVSWQPVSDEERAELAKLNATNAIEIAIGASDISNDTPPSSLNADGGVQIGD